MKAFHFGFVIFDSKHILRNDVEKTNIRFFGLRALPENSLNVMNFQRNREREVERVRGSEKEREKDSRIFKTKLNGFSTY